MVNAMPCSANSTPRLHGETARLLLAFGCLRGLGGLLVFPLEALHTSGCVEQLLLPGEEGVAARANLDSHEIRFIGGSRFEGAAAGANDINLVISGVNSSLHFVTGDPFEISSIAKIQTPVRPMAHGGR